MSKSMKPLKPISTIIDKEALAEFLNERYHFDCQVKLLKAGVNHSYHIKNGDDEYVFRIYSFNWRSYEEINAEVKHLLFLQENGISVSYPIANPSGEYILEVPAFEGLRYGVLFSFAKGEKLLTFSKNLHYKIGVTMARMHQLLLNKTINRVSYTSDVLLEDTFNYLPELLDSKSFQYQFLLKLKFHLQTVIENVAPRILRQGVTHMDIWFDNMNILEEELTIFDFDFCGNGWLAFDIAYYIMQIHSTETDVVEFENKKNAFIDGYESILKIPVEEKNILPELGLAVLVFYIGIQCKRFDNWTNAFLNEMHLKRLIDLRVKRWFDFNGLRFLDEVELG